MLIVLRYINLTKFLDFANDYAFSIIGKFIFASLIATFRHGREEDEVMGISFKKELVVDRVQVQSAEKKGEENSKLQVIYHISLMRIKDSTVISLSHHPDCQKLARQIGHPFMIQSHAESIKKIVGALWVLPAQ